MSEKHTPTPWIAYRRGDGTWCVGTNSPATTIALMTRDMVAVMGTLAAAPIDADFIVRAVNCHDELVAALKELVEIEKRDCLGDPDTVATDTHRNAAWVLACAALAKAEGSET